MSEGASENVPATHRIPHGKGANSRTEAEMCIMTQRRPIRGTGLSRLLRTRRLGATWGHYEVVDSGSDVGRKHTWLPGAHGARAARALPAATPGAEAATGERLREAGASVVLVAPSTLARASRVGQDAPSRPAVFLPASVLGLSLACSPPWPQLD